MNVIVILLIATARTMALEHGITLHKGTIRMCYGPSGELYCVPMYLINPPEKYGTESIAENDENPGEEIKVVFNRTIS